MSDFENILNIIDKQVANFNSMKSNLLKIVKLAKYSSELLKEYIFEEVRQNKFPDKPSRKNCIFCLSENCDISDMREKYNLNEQLRPTVVKIEGIENEFKILVCDSNLLNCNIYKFNEIESYAIKYWSGNVTSTPLIEILFFGKFKIVEIL